MNGGATWAGSASDGLDLSVWYRRPRPASVDFVGGGGTGGLHGYRPAPALLAPRSAQSFPSPPADLEEEPFPLRPEPFPMFPPSWRLNVNPFATPQSADCFYCGEAQQEALARLRYLVDGGRRFGWLTGAAGLGKTMLLEYFAREQRRGQAGVALVHAGGLTPADVAWQLAADLSLGPTPGESTLRLFRRLTDFAATYALLGQRALLLMDDADLSGPDLWSFLERLIHIAPTTRWLTLIVAADFVHGEASYPRLLETASLQVELEPWKAEETAGAVWLALEQAGGKKSLFSDEACDQLYRVTGGTPRTVYRYAEQALLAAAAEQADEVTARHVTQAAAEETLAMRYS